MNDEMFKILKTKQGNYDTLIPLTDSTHSEITEDSSYTDIGVPGYHRRTLPLHMDPPVEYADVYRRGTRTQVLPMPVSDALANQELSLIGSVHSTMDELIPWPEVEVD
ncbi:hypothetical protein X975_24178, partial [Stegodyphus mimosarum]